MEDKKELSVIKTRVTKMNKTITDLDIKDDDSFKFAVKILSGIKDVQKGIRAWKDTRIKPIKVSIRQIEADIRPHEDRCKEAEGIVKTQMLTYHREVEAKRLEQEDKVAKQVEQGTIKVETAAKKLQKTPEAETFVSGEDRKGSISIKKVKKVRFTSLNLMFAEDIQKLIKGGYIKWDEIAARSAVLSGGKELPGVEIYFEDSISAK